MSKNRRFDVAPYNPPPPPLSLPKDTPFGTGRRPTGCEPEQADQCPDRAFLQGSVPVGKLIVARAVDPRIIGNREALDAISRTFTDTLGVGGFHIYGDSEHPRLWPYATILNQRQLKESVRRRLFPTGSVFTDVPSIMGANTSHRDPLTIALGPTIVYNDGISRMPNYGYDTDTHVLRMPIQPSPAELILRQEYIDAFYPPANSRNRPQNPQAPQTFYLQIGEYVKTIIQNNMIGNVAKALGRVLEGHTITLEPATLVSTDRLRP